MEDVFREYMRQYARERRYRKYHGEEDFKRKELNYAEKWRCKQRGLDYNCYYMQQSADVLDMIKNNIDTAIIEVKITKVNDEYKLQIKKELNYGQ